MKLPFEPSCPRPSVSWLIGWLVTWSLFYWFDEALEDLLLNRRIFMFLFTLPSLPIFVCVNCCTLICRCSTLCEGGGWMLYLQSSWKGTVVSVICPLENWPRFCFCGDNSVTNPIYILHHVLLTKVLETFTHLYHGTALPFFSRLL